MGFNRVRLGELIAISDLRNTDGHFGLSNVRGITVDKKFTATKADLTGVSLNSYKVVRPGEFAYVPDTSRRGNKICLAYNRSSMPYLVSSVYCTFSVSSRAVLPDYLYILFNRPEFDRYSRFNSWGSARETFSWGDLSDTEIVLPSIDIQRKYVAIYKAIFSNQRIYEQSLEDIKTVCNASYDQCKHTDKYVKLDTLLSEVDTRNADDLKLTPMGITLDHRFQVSRAKLKDNRNYKIVKPGQIVVNLIQIGRDAAYPIAINETEEIILVSPDYKVFQPKNDAIAYYLLGWFCRSEVGRHGWFICDDGVRGRLSINKFLNLRVPYPNERTIEAVAALQKSHRLRDEINERLKTLLKDICPVLIRGSIEEASR